MYVDMYLIACVCKSGYQLSPIHILTGVLHLLCSLWVQRGACRHPLSYVPHPMYPIPPHSQKSPPPPWAVPHEPGGPPGMAVPSFLRASRSTFHHINRPAAHFLLLSLMLWVILCFPGPLFKSCCMRSAYSLCGWSGFPWSSGMRVHCVNQVALPALPMSLPIFLTKTACVR